jgi:hypothetical protein
MKRGGEIVIVTPVYEDREASSRLFADIGALGMDAMIVVVDDGSIRSPVEASSIVSAGLHGVVIRLVRNVGHQRAIAIGLSYVAEQYPDAACVVTMDSDGEDVPHSIPSMVEPLDSADVDVVVASRRKRQESLRFRAFYVIYKSMFRTLTGRQIDFGNFMVFKPSAARRLTRMQEAWIHVAGCVLTSGLRVIKCPVDRGSRYSGTSKMNFAGLVLHGFRAFMIFAEDILVRVGTFCAAIAALSIVGIIHTLFLKLFDFATPGWFSVALGILILMLFQTGALTLMTLMLTGIVKGVRPPVDYRVLIEEVIPARRQV